MGWSFGARYLTGQGHRQERSIVVPAGAPCLARAGRQATRRANAFSLSPLTAPSVSTL